MNVFAENQGERKKHPWQFARLEIFDRFVYFLSVAGKRKLFTLFLYSGKNEIQVPELYYIPERKELKVRGTIRDNG